MQRFKNFFTEPRVPYGLLTIGIILAMIVGYAAVGSGRLAPLPAPTTPVHYAVGDTIQTDSIALKVESFRFDLKGVPGFAPMPGYQFLMPMVTIANRTNTNFELIPLLFFYIKDSKGNVYHPTAAPIVTDQLTGPILPGEKVREELGFEVPVGTRNPALYFERGTAGHPVIVIDLATSTQP